MLWQLLHTSRDLGRLQEIASVLARHGFGDLVGRLGLERALARAGRWLHVRGATESARQVTVPERIRCVLEELGPLFVKLGQVLATRVDLFPRDWIEEFEKLRSHVPPVPFDQIRSQIEEVCGAPPEEVFRDLEISPLAGGSIAQVHGARLADGTRVVLKVRRPGIRPVVEADLRILRRFATIAAEEIAELHRFRPVEIVRQLERCLRDELDLEREGRNAETIAQQFAGRAEIVIPRVYREWTGETLNVQERIDGIPAGEVDEARAAGRDLPRLARLGSQLVLEMVLVHGFFHADPHPGNIFLLPGDRVALIDFGMVGRLAPRRREELVDLLFGLVERDAESVAEIVCEWNEPVAADPGELVSEVEALLDEYHGVPLEDLSFAAMLGDVLRVLREHDLALPPELSMLFKIVFLLEDLGRQLDPEFNLVEEVRPFLQRTIRDRYRPAALAREGLRHVRETAALVNDMPGDLRSILRAVRRGRFQMHVRADDLERFGARVERTANRAIVGMVTSALIVGTSIAMTVEAGPRLFELPVFAFLGFASSFGAGVWLLFSMWRSRRRGR